ncbi:hypothetical protein PN836_017525 [Ningiella sp. W23]|uniref:hypothetical protein n=1 Tax=Ningiella sp. W23 TaxID=3023715 RepID=UPI003757D4AA
MKYIRHTLKTLGLFLALTTGLANATPILSFDASEANLVKNVGLGDSFVIDLWISNLGENDDLGGFDIDFVSTSNPGNFNLLDVYLAPGLEEFDLLSLIIDDVSNISGLSFAFDLSAQANQFPLVSFEFEASSFGTTVIEVTDAMLSDAFGLSLGFTAFSATVNVTPPPISASAPGALLSLFAALTVICLRRKQN